MNYHALNTKIKAAQQQECDYLRWLPSKSLRDFMHIYEGTDPVATWKRLARLDKNNRQALAPTLGMEIDLMNIVWMYRLKKFYNVIGEGTFGRLMPVRYRLTEEETKQMALAKDEDALLTLVGNSPYGTVFPSFTRPELKAYTTLAIQHKKQARLHPNSLAPLCAELFALKMEHTWLKK